MSTLAKLPFIYREVWGGTSLGTWVTEDPRQSKKTENSHQQALCVKKRNCGVELASLFPTAALVLDTHFTKKLVESVGIWVLKLFLVYPQAEQFVKKVWNCIYYLPELTNYSNKQSKHKESNINTQFDVC